MIHRRKEDHEKDDMNILIQNRLNGLYHQMKKKKKRMEGMM
jgi:hypothetical protein